MGRKGIEAAMEAAEMVLADDDFASIVAAVRKETVVLSAEVALFAALEAEKHLLRIMASRGGSGRLLRTETA
jgi:hypothetical protein